MKYNIFKTGVLLAMCAFLAPACQKEYLNPSTADEQEIVKDVNGLIALCNGLQYRFTVGRQSPIYAGICANGFTTLELAILNPGNVDENFLSIGNDKLVGNNAVLTNLWEQCNLTKSNAEIVLNNASNVGDPGTRAGIVAYGSIYKAMALGTLAQFWQQLPLRVEEKAQFSGREEALKEAVALLENAAAELRKASVPASFTNKTVGGIDLKNTAFALTARYAAMLGDWPKALSAVDSVNLTKKSEFKYDDLTRNPIFDVAISNVNVFQPVDSALGLKGALAPSFKDGRVSFYLASKTPSSTNVYKGKGFWAANSAPIPVYLPGEMLLIRAEGLARQDKIPEAITELNKVLTKTNDLYGVNANLPAYSGDQTKDAVLTEIYRNRCIELFMSGLKLEDSRRFGRQASASNLTERNRDWYPYPFNERDNNSNTPADPAF